MATKKEFNPFEDNKSVSSSLTFLSEVRVPRNEFPFKGSCLNVAGEVDEEFLIRPLTGTIESYLHSPSPIESPLRKGVKSEEACDNGMDEEDACSTPLRSDLSWDSKFLIFSPQGSFADPGREVIVVEDDSFHSEHSLELRAMEKRKFSIFEACKENSFLEPEMFERDYDDQDLDQDQRTAIMIAEAMHF